MDYIHALKYFTKHDLWRMSTPDEDVAGVYTYVLVVEPFSYNCGDELKEGRCHIP
jgi:hypothetical protein